MRKMLKRKKRLIILIAIPLAIIIAGVIFFQFTNIGYCMTVRFRDFTEVEHNIFVNNTFSYNVEYTTGEIINIDVIPEIVSEARKRVAELFGGELLSDPVIIISDDSRTYRISGDRHTYTGVLFGKVFSYISLSHSYVRVDFLAHELTHTELHYRLLSGKMFRFNVDRYVPIWFDEGLASIPDHRRIFDDETWNIRTDNGTNIDVDVTALTRADFRGMHVDDPFFNALIIQEFFLFSRHEILSWLEENGTGGLLQLIDGIREGEDFHNLYNSE
jgi:hypothetical protein